MYIFILDEMAKLAKVVMDDMAVAEMGLDEMAIDCSPYRIPENSFLCTCTTKNCIFNDYISFFLFQIRERPHPSGLESN